MPQAVYVLFGAAFTAAVATALGRLMLRAAEVDLRRSEEDPIAFVTGSALLSLIVFILLIIGLGTPWVFAAIGLLILGIAVWRGAHVKRRLELDALPPLWRWAWLAGFGAFTFVYLANAMAPEISPDGAAYHLSFVARYLREHRLVFIPTNMYAQLSQGIEMLFTFAFAFGKHSAAALVHFTFLIALALAILNYGRRIRHPAAGAAASLLIYASPLFGKDGISAYIDVGTAAIVFTVFYLLEVWRERPERRAPLAVIGLLSGFAFATKYTAFLAVPYAMLYVWSRRREWRGPLIVGACSLILALPWVVKNQVYVGNPVSPMMNSLFPNPVVSVAFEQDWTATMRQYHLPSLWRIPWELTVRGEYLEGLFGALFLLAPVGLAAVRYPEGRRLLIAFAVFALPYPMNIGARFLIPAAPFVALAMALAWSNWPAILAAVTALHVVSSWPSVLPLYAGRYAWRLEDVPVRAALRIEPEEHFLARKRPDYAMIRSIQQRLAPGQRVLMMNSMAEAYTTRDVLVGFQSSSGQTLTDMLATANAWDVQPTRVVRLPLPSRRARRLRVQQTAAVPHPVQWNVHEVRLYNGDVELPRRPQWRINARPNPWEVQLAFDNSPVTRWRSKQAPSPGMYIEIDLGSELSVDRVDVYTSADCDPARMRLLQWVSGQWQPVTAAPQKLDLERPAFLGLAAMQEWNARGVGYLVLCNADWGAREILRQLPAWKLTLMDTHGECHLLRNDAGMPPLKEGTEWRTTSAWTGASPAPRH